MRVPLSWLREYVDFDLGVDELVEEITLHSQEIDGVSRFGVQSGEVVVGEVVDFAPHPNADRLNVAKVDLGGREVQIVAGAPNPYPGARVPVVLPGSVMADGTKLRKAKLRGLESYGMMMSERELGVSGDHEGILLLDESHVVGRAVEEYFPVGEVVLDIDVTPNRPDLWGMIGVARELAAILRTDFHVPDISFETGGAPTTGDFTLAVEDPEFCPRYDLRRISGVAPNTKAPLKIRRWLHASGLRPISAVVDATNFVMLETGQPIHAFDASKIVGGIVVRHAHLGELITLIDDSVRELDETTLVISDEERGRAIAGVMGGEDSEVAESTEDLLIEVANFDGRGVLEVSSRLGLRTEASGRFERGLDPNMVTFAMDRVSSLISNFTGGKVASDKLSEYSSPVERWNVPMRIARAELLLGMQVEEREASEVLERLGCEVEVEEETLRATVPTFRRDLRREVDLIEEVGRLIGLDKIPDELPETSIPGGLTEEQRKTRLIRRLLADLGLSEAMLYPFGPRRWRRDLGLDDAVRLENPLSAEVGELRSSMLPSLLDAAARNRAFGANGGGLFEVGKVFETAEVQDRESALDFRMTGERRDADESALTGVVEESKVGAVLAGTVRPAGWNVPALGAGFFEAKGIVERLVPDASFEPGGAAFLHPGRSAVVKAGEREIGWVGELHPAALEKFDLDGWTVAAFELDLSSCRPDIEPRFEPFANVPAVDRDLAVVVEAGAPVGEMLSEIEESGGEFLVESRVFDVYEGDQVPEGRKSVAFAFVFQGDETLTDEAVNDEVQRISTRLRERFGARVRGA